MCAVRKLLIWRVESGVRDIFTLRTLARVRPWEVCLAKIPTAHMPRRGPGFVRGRGYVYDRARRREGDGIPGPVQDFVPSPAWSRAADPSAEPPRAGRPEPPEAGGPAPPRRPAGRG